MCEECANECIGITPCGNCAVLKKERENKLNGWDVLTFVSIIVVAYLWSLVSL